MVVSRAGSRPVAARLRQSAAGGDAVRSGVRRREVDLGESGVNVMRVRMVGRWRDVVGVGGKSGVYTLLDAKTGEFIWNTLVGPGGDRGGMNWGTAFDGDRIYVSVTNRLSTGARGI